MWHMDTHSTQTKTQKHIHTQKKTLCTHIFTHTKTHKHIHTKIHHAHWYTHAVWQNSNQTQTQVELKPNTEYLSV